MARQIISLFPVFEAKVLTQPEFTGHLVEAAWVFARCSLWPDRALTEPEVSQAQEYIRNYLYAARHKKKRAFIAMCQRITLMQKYIRLYPGFMMPSPADWFDQEYPNGFPGTLPWLVRINQQRKLNHGYLGHIKVLAVGIYQYVINPSELRYRRCRRGLQYYRAKSLLQLFDETIKSYHNLKPVAEQHPTIIINLDSSWLSSRSQ